MNQNPKKMIITPETHWDREWYLPFQSYRAKLVLLLDKLLDMIKINPDYANFTFDGQTVILQDYLEVRPEREAELMEAIKNRKISVGPMYILPDEYLVSGESMIRNLLLGHKIANKFGKVMKSAYIPDPFGHFAQLPQILSGFELPTILFARGFGNSFDDLNLDMEFQWNSPGKAASIIGIHLIKGYDSVAKLSDDKDEDGTYNNALDKIEMIMNGLNEHSCTGILPLNNGSDHLFAQPHIPDVVKQWNEKYPDIPLVQGDFGEYSELMMAENPQLKEFTGELHGGKFQYLLSGVYSARMWIKQKNAEIQNLLEKYTEPVAALNWLLLDKKYPNPTEYIWKSWQWLLRNHPHDSICGCSIDEVHDVDMKFRFYNSKIMAEEILKDSLLQLSYNIEIDEMDGERLAIIVYNPQPWERSENVSVNLYGDSQMEFIFNDMKAFMIKNADGNECAYDIELVQPPDQFKHIKTRCYNLKFKTKNVPAMGYATYYIYPGEEPEFMDVNGDSNAFDIKTGENWLENKFYKIILNNNGTFTVNDKETGISYNKVAYIEDGGDWGDEYDYSGPKPDQQDKIITNLNLDAEFKIIKGYVSARAFIKYKLNIPKSLNTDENRPNRIDDCNTHEINIKIELPSEEKLIKIILEFNNQSKDHRFRMVFPTGIKSDKIYADGHFYVVPRSLTPPKDDDWTQKWVPTHHQNKFVSVDDDKNCVTVMNKGLPEYEAIISEDGKISFAITLLRSIGWLSRGDFSTRVNNAGPDLCTPGAQCLGKHKFELALTTSKLSWIDSGVLRIAEQFISELQPAVPLSIKSMLRIINGVPLDFGNLESKSTTNEDERKLPANFSFVKINNSNISLSTLKIAEDASGLILRLVNMADIEQRDKLKFFKNIKGAVIVNLNEEVPINKIKADISINNEILNIKLHPNCIVTIKLVF